MGKGRDRRKRLKKKRERNEQLRLQGMQLPNAKEADTVGNAPKGSDEYPPGVPPVRRGVDYHT